MGQETIDWVWIRALPVRALIVMCKKDGATHVTSLELNQPLTIPSNVTILTDFVS